MIRALAIISTVVQTALAAEPSANVCQGGDRPAFACKTCEQCHYCGKKGRWGLRPKNSATCRACDPANHPPRKPTP